MKFKTDCKFVITQTLLAILGYFIGLFIVLSFLNINDIPSFIGESLCGGLVLYLLIVYPKAIYITDKYISFVPKNRFIRKKICLDEIVSIEEKSNPLYRTICIQVQNGRSYCLHPADNSKFYSMISREKEFR